MNRDQKRAVIGATIAQGFLDATKDTGHAWKRGEDMTVACEHCGVLGKDLAAAMEKCRGG